MLHFFAMQFLPLFPVLLSAFIFGGFGLIVGSFLNVIVLRKGVMSITGRSQCPSCGHLIYWYDNIPVLSWLILRGRCRFCGSSISIQYPLVEASSAILFGLIGMAFFNTYVLTGQVDVIMLCLVSLSIASILIAIAVYDIRHTIIPDEWAYAFALIAFAVNGYLALTNSNHPSLALFVLSGPLAALPLFALWFVSGGRWMGLGDPKLALGIGWLLGFPNGLMAVFFSFILGSLITVPLLVAHRIITHMSEYHNARGGLTMKSEVPFGPFLIASCLLFWILGLYGFSVPLDLFGF